jgi:prepilin-type N-terminal cleavage/methylation domain-containing protein
MHNETRDRDSDAGFTLAEMLIATAITLIVLSAAVEMMTSTMSLTSASRLTSETNHGLQAGMSLMVRDFMQTGQGIPLGGIPLPSGGGAAAVVRPGPASTLTFPAGATTLPALSPGNGIGPTLLGVQTDVVTLLYIDRTLDLSAYPLVSIATDGSTMTVNASTPITGVDGIKAGDLILFSNAQGNALQMVTQTPSSQIVDFATGDSMLLNQRGAPQGTIMNLQSSPGVFPPTTALRVMMISYFVDDTTDPTLPRLVRRINLGNNLAIAMGVENLQVTYDLVDGVSNPTNVDEPASGYSANQIRKVNLFVSARSQDLNQQTHQYFRNSMATQVGLRSLSFVDRYR